jgi:hypothetical protein
MFLTHRAVVHENGSLQFTVYKEKNFVALGIELFSFRTFEFPELRMSYLCSVKGAGFARGHLAERV